MPRLLTAAERPDLWDRGGGGAVAADHGQGPGGESWTGMVFPESGDYVFPDGLAPVHVDREADVATYWEPNVWMVHPDLTG